MIPQSPVKYVRFNLKNNISNVSIVGYNILKCKEKIYNFDFIQFLQQFDILFFIWDLLDRRMRFWKLSVLFKKYNLSWSFVEKAYVAGRSSGGSICVKKEERIGQFFNFITVSNLKCVFCKHSSQVFCTVPIYLNCNFWDRDFGKL